MDYSKITKDHILKAIELIEENGVPKSLHSSTYDVFYNEKRYPPKLVTSQAYKIAYSKELDHSDFSASPAIEYLKSKDVLIINKNVNVWKVSQPEENRNEGYETYTCSQGWNHGGDLSWLFYNFRPKIKLDFEVPKLSLDIELLSDDEKVNLLWNDNKKPAKHAFKRIFRDIKSGDIVVLYNGMTPTHIGEVPKKFVYLFNEELYFGNCLFPIKYYKIEDVFKKIEDVNTASSFGVIGIVRYDNSDKLKNIWYSHREHNNITDLFPKEKESQFNEIKNNIKESIEKSRINILKKINSINMKSDIELLKSNKNLIFTGAPGTGKTYLAKQIALMILFNKQDEKDLTEDEKKIFLEHYSFVQFHPSYDYTDFVEGLRPVKKEGEDLGFELKNGTFKEVCIRALERDTKDNFDEIYNQFINDVSENGIILKTPTHKREFKVEINSNKSCFAIPNTEIGTQMSITKEMIRSYIYKGEIRDWKPYTIPIGDYIKNKYDIKELSIKKSDKPYIIVIDEINRAEISKVFGELFFSIDSGYRGEDGKVKTQYANIQTEDTYFSNIENDYFYVPENVYIIGTMNDIDRSVESFDFAMRRRFAWKEIKAIDRIEMLDSLTEKEIAQDWIDTAKNKLAELNKAIWNEDFKEPEDNKEKKQGIEGLNSAYHIGPAYFLKLENYKTKEKDEAFQMLWDNHLRVLLQEYLRGMRNADKLMIELEDAYNSAK